MPHAGRAVLRGLAAALERAGIAEGRLDPRAVYPEAGSLLEARMLDALARAASPMAIDLLLAQPERWAMDPGAATDGARDRVLRRLIDPPLVVAIGAPNIGKSSLVNALAGRRVALVADEPGTTRDHVGVLIDAGGVVIRYVDTPGIRAAADGIEAEAAAIAERLVGSADLVLRCGDAGAAPPEAPGRGESLVVATRMDLGRPGWRAEAATSALTGEGLPGLVAAIRERLVPAALAADPAPWRFWED
jgi:tRNA modification GTPase